MPDDANRLAELFEPDEVTVVGIAPGANRDVEVELVVRGVRLVLSNVTIHGGPSQRRTAEAQRDRVRTGDHTDTASPLQPDPVIRQQFLVFQDLRVHDVAERARLVIPATRNVERETADTHGVVGQPGTAVLLEQIEDQLPFAERVEEHGHRADVHGVRTKPQTVTRDALELRENRADIPSAPRHLDFHQLLDGLAIAEVVGGGRHVIHPVGQQDDLGPVPIFAEFLDTAVDVPHHDIDVLHSLAVESQDQTQDPMRARVLRAHVEHELVGIEHRRGFGGHL